MRLRHLLPVALCLGGAVAQADTGSDVMRGMASCEGALFTALARDAPRWKLEPSYVRQPPLASFRVTNRTPPEHRGRAGDAIVEFTKARELGGLHLLSFHDSDLSEWSVFRDQGVRFVGWGFYVYELPEDVVTWFKLHVPERAKHLSRSRAQKDDVFCIEEVLSGNSWKRVQCAADDGFPSTREPRRWFVVRADSSDPTRSVISCEYAGDVPPELMQKYRPDLRFKQAAAKATKP